MTTPFRQRLYRPFRARAPAAAELWPELCFDLPELQYPPRLNCVPSCCGAAAAMARTALRGGRATGPMRSCASRWTASPMCCAAAATGSRQPRAAARREHAHDGGLHAGGDEGRLIAVPTMPLLRARELA
jgi:2-aminobenzoate-CoA ligase